MVEVEGLEAVAGGAVVGQEVDLEVLTATSVFTLTTFEQVVPEGLEEEDNILHHNLDINSSLLSSCSYF